MRAGQAAGALRIVEAHAGPALDDARTLMAEYAALPHVAGRWPDPAADIAALPGPFVAPAGALLVAYAGDRPVGCGALRDATPGARAEVKRIYVRPEARGLGAGRALTVALMDLARARGATHVRLDTAPELTAARQLYATLGFTPISRYDPGQLPDAVCLERAL